MKLIKEIYSKSFFSDLNIKAKAIVLWPLIIYNTRSKNLVSSTTRNHEMIHVRQLYELLIIGFYLIYILEWFMLLFKYDHIEEAYRNISFEIEAYKNQHDLSYLKKRKAFSWFKYLMLNIRRAFVKKG